MGRGWKSDQPRQPVSKRLRRLFPPFVQDALKPLVPQEVNVVRRDGRTIFGRLEVFEDDSLLVRDLRSHPHKVQLADIAEIIYDQKSEIFPKIDEPL